MAKILIIEDDKPLAQLIQRLLNQAGYWVDIAFDLASVKTHAQHNRTLDLILCDIMLPDGDGLTFSEFLQTEFSCPFIFLTALDSDDTQVKGLNLGASDYLIKPIKPEVLLARVKAALRRAGVDINNKLQLGQLRLDDSRQQAFFGKTDLELGQDEFKILKLMLNQDPKPVSREKLFNKIIGREYNGADRAIDLKISRLRKKMAAHQTSLGIKSIRGEGYMLTLDAK